MALSGCAMAGFRTPTAAILSRPLQHCQVASCSCPGAGFLTPAAAIQSRPLHDCQVASCSCLIAGVLLPTAAILSRPVQDCKVAPSGCARARALIPRAAHSGGAIAATPGGLQQLLQHTTSVPMLGSGVAWVEGLSCII